MHILFVFSVIHSGGGQKAHPPYYLKGVFQITSYVIFAIILCLSLLASAWDLKTYRIPNWLTFGAILVGLSVNIVFYGLDGLTNSFGGLLLGGAVMFPFFWFGGMGGGDVKLAAAFGALGGFYFTINTLLWGSLIGGVASLIIILYRRGFLKSIKRLYADFIVIFILKTGLNNTEKAENEIEKKEKILLPYGVFISLGALISLFKIGVIVCA